jgi:HupE / UreJ protein
VQELVMNLKLTAPGGRVTDFDLRYDAIIDRLVTHKALATVRSQWANGAMAPQTPDRLVESLIALSILVSAVHALRPLIPGGEACIAFGFGLVHSLAFATVLAALGLHGGALVTSLLGFNLGIEQTQLLVVVLLMPSLYLLSRTALYGPIRIALGVGGVALAGAWLLERTTVIGTDPFAPVTSALMGHPLIVPGVLALLAAVVRYAAPRRTRALRLT